MKVSIITVSYNSDEYIRNAIESVLSQDYKNIEYIIIDGGSADGTKDIVLSFNDRISCFISEKDDGIYDAMNKGISLATGDIIGLLNADDFYIDNQVISQIVRTFETHRVDSVFADIIYIDHKDFNHVIRYYDSSHFRPEKFAFGWMPAHPSFFVKKEIYRNSGLFKLDYQIAADFELLARFIYRDNISYKYIDKALVKMRKGGISTKNLYSNWILNKEIIRACRENRIKTNYLKIYSKYLLKIFEYINIRKKMRVKQNTSTGSCTLND
jgi:glycosyltransferase involved in cell wall biosynthesis